MSPPRIPIKLNKEPLVEALFEMRFTSATSASNIIPGVLITSFGANKKIERLPAGNLPEQLRANDPAFQFQPLLRLQSDRFIYLVGDSSLAIACKLPYPGWREFEPEVLRVVKAVAEIGIIDSVSRFSLKYVDIVEGQVIAEQIRRVKLTLELGDHAITSDPFTFRTEILREGIASIVQIAAPSVANLSNGKSINGIAIDIDIIFNLAFDDVQEFMNGLSDNLQLLHTRMKEIFFEWCLTPETIDFLEPVYE